MKRIIVSTLIAILCLTLASCAGPADQRPAAETKTQAIREEPTVKQSAHTTEAAAETETGFACDAVFFGDSITADSNFDEFFPELRIVNLGVYGDTIEDLSFRVSQVQEAKPARIFLLVGINCLRADNVEDCALDYSALVRQIREACPKAVLHIQSVLPIGAEIEHPAWCTNETVRAFNEELNRIAQENDLPYIDLYSLYETNGALDPAMTRDGLHLNFNCYSPWAEAISPYLTGG